MCREVVQPSAKTGTDRSHCACIECMHAIFAPLVCYAGLKIVVLDEKLAVLVAEYAVAHPSAHVVVQNAEAKSLQSQHAVADQRESAVRSAVQFLENLPSREAAPLNSDDELVNGGQCSSLIAHCAMHMREVKPRVV